jgi:thymidylate kinase
MEKLVPLELVIRLCNALAAGKIDYCHWKSTAALDRSASGDNDLDLLVSRVHVQRFTETLYRLGFKAALPPKGEGLPGVQDYYGYDEETGRLVHVHAHFQLILGSDLSKNYHLPLERVYLASSVQGNLFRIPAPEFELVILVIRLVLKHSMLDAILMLHGRLSPSEQRELDYLLTPSTAVKAKTVLQHVPGMSDKLFNDCMQVIQPGCSFWLRIKIGSQLRKVLQSSARYSHLSDVMTKFSRRAGEIIQSRVLGYLPKKRMASGGLFIAIVGGDGAGKTTLIDAIFSWLSAEFSVKKIHFGKPDWSRITILIRGILKIGTILHLYPFEGDVYEESYKSHGLPWFIRAVCTARDRYLTYTQARRLASNGELVLCDRFSFPGFMVTDGPQCEPRPKSPGEGNRLRHFLAKMEMSYYRQIGLPDLLIVLKVKPELAVQRKRDESAVTVLARSSEVWSLDWTEKSAYVIDANLPKAEVTSQVKRLVWAYL